MRSPLVTLACLLCFVPFAGDAEGQDRTPPRLVRSERVEIRRPGRELRFSATTRPETQATLSFTVAGRLVERAGPRGSLVSAEDVVARIDTAPLENAALESEVTLSRARIEWRKLRRERERIQRLIDVGARSRRDLELAIDAEKTARTAVLSAQAGLAEAERRLDEGSLRAPFSGRIIDLLLEPGEYAQPGAPVLVLSGGRQLKIEFGVPESVVSELSFRTPVRVEFPLSEARPAMARIQSITYAAEDSSALYPVVACLDPQDEIIAGMSAEAVVEIAGTATLLVPVDAVIDATGEAATVFRITDGHAERVDVEVLDLFGDRVAVRGELQEGDEVIVAGQAVLLEGEPVYVEAPASPEQP
jgi:RND family efflux transporter MFP subunit